MLGARSDDRLAELAETLRSDGAEAEHCRCDIGSVADTAALVDKTLARYGRLDVVPAASAAAAPVGSLTSQKSASTSSPV